MFGSTEIKFSVPLVKEIDAPLGGISVIYIVSISEGDSNYTISKTFRELEDVAKKLTKKYTNLRFPEMSIILEDPNTRKQAADSFMKFLTKNAEIIQPDMVKQLLGFDSESNYDIQATSDVSEKPILVARGPTKSTMFPRKDKKLDNAEDDLFQEFANSNKLKKQQKGSASFFDDVLDDEDENLFGVPTKTTYKKNIPINDNAKPKTQIAEETDNSNQTTENIDVETKEDKMTSSLEVLEKDVDLNEDEIDDSILRLEDDIDDLQHLSQRKIEKPLNINQEMKPMVPMKRPGLSATGSGSGSSKPLPPPKPSQLIKARPIGTEMPESPVDISSYINSEQAAQMEDVKLFD